MGGAGDTCTGQRILRRYRTTKCITKVCVCVCVCVCVRACVRDFFGDHLEGLQPLAGEKAPTHSEVSGPFDRGSAKDT